MPTTPVITLLSDLGTSHPAISGIKVILGKDADVIDITHRITTYNLQQAAHMIAYAYPHFPNGTVHLLLLDIMLGERHRMLLAKVNGHYFIAPDNGILSLAFGKVDITVWLCREFSGSVSILDWVAYAQQVISTIHQSADLNEHFSQFMVKEVAPLAAQKPIGARLDCSILHIDRYGNVVIGFTKDQFQELIQDGPFSIKLPRHTEITTVSNHYNDVARGAPLCRFNSMGYMEIAVNHDSASQTFELDTATDKGVNYSVVTINF